MTRVPAIRDAVSKDAAALSALISELGFEVPAEDLASRIQVLAGSALIADDDGPIGCLTWNIMPVLHRATPVGRISMLVVSSSRRSEGIGSALVAEAERRLCRSGCGLIEVTSNDRLIQAHRFYERRGYQRTSVRFAKAFGE